MLVPIAAGIAAAVSKALAPPAALNMLGPNDRIDVDRPTTHHIENFMSKGTSFLNSVMMQPPSSTVNAEKIKNKTTERSEKKKRKLPPPLPKTDDPFDLLGLDFRDSPSLEDIRVAYKQKVKIYHPDMLLSTDSNETEREKASADFGRIVAAFEKLKKEGDETSNNVSVEFSYDKHENDQRFTKFSYRNIYDDPYRIDYNRLWQNAEYSRQKAKWYDDEYYYGPPIESQQAQHERWWNQHETDYVYDNYRYQFAKSPGGFARRQDFHDYRAVNHYANERDFHQQYEMKGDGKNDMSTCLIKQEVIPTKGTSMINIKTIHLVIDMIDSEKNGGLKSMM
eukprot:scaffold22086_cov71-Cyclotella_meneghiniana.AAC.11